MAVSKSKMLEIYWGNETGLSNEDNRGRGSSAIGTHHKMPALSEAASLTYRHYKVSA
jgi:hypothetical protein